MSSGVRIVGRPAVMAGMALTGLPVTPVEDVTGAAAACDRWLDDPQVAVVLLEQELHDRLSDETRRRLSHHPLLMVVPFPGPRRLTASGDADAFIVDLLRRVIGYRVRLR